MKSLKRSWLPRLPQTIELLIQNITSVPEGLLMHCANHSPSVSPSPLSVVTLHTSTTIDWFSYFSNFLFSSFKYKWNHTICILFCPFPVNLAKGLHKTLFSITLSALNLYYLIPLLKIHSFIFMSRIHLEFL